MSPSCGHRTPCRPTEARSSGLGELGFGSLSCPSAARARPASGPVAAESQSWGCNCGQHACPVGGVQECVPEPWGTATVWTSGLVRAHTRKHAQPSTQLPSICSARGCLPLVPCARSHHCQKNYLKLGNRPTRFFPLCLYFWLIFYWLSYFTVPQEQWWTGRFLFIWDVNNFSVVEEITSKVTVSGPVGPELFCI